MTRPNTAGLSAKLAAAKEYLGANWVLSPNYRFRPRHSNDKDIYVPARQPYLHAVSAVAQKCREANPFYTRRVAGS